MMEILFSHKAVVFVVIHNVFPVKKASALLKLFSGDGGN